MKKINWSVLLLIISYSAYSQDYAFQVMVNKGANEVKSGSTWAPIKTGASLKSGDELKLSDNSYLGLRHASGKMVEVKKAGPYKVADLAANLSGGATVLNKYTDFILSANSPEAKKNRLSATGAVHRGSKDAIDLFLPENQSSGIFGTKVILDWEATAEGPYVVELQNMFEDVLAVYETTNNFLAIDLSDPRLSDKDLNAIMVKITSKNDSKISSSTKMIKKLTAEEERKMKAQVAELGDALVEETAINKFILAGFFEQNNLLVDAITAYQQAIALEPTLQVEYEDFLVRKGLKEAKKQ
jgi:hypothetical protein